MFLDINFEPHISSVHFALPGNNVGNLTFYYKTAAEDSIFKWEVSRYPNFNTILSTGSHNTTFIGENIEPRIQSPLIIDGIYYIRIGIVEDDGTYNILKTGQIVIGNPPPPPKFPIEFFGLMLVIIYVLGMCVILRGVFLPYKALNKGDVYLRGSIFLISLSLTLFSSIGIYITKDDVGYILGLDEYWIIVPFSIAVVSLFATVYAWLSVFGKKKKEEI